MNLFNFFRTKRKMANPLDVPDEVQFLSGACCIWLKTAPLTGPFRVECVYARLGVHGAVGGYK